MFWLQNNVFTGTNAKIYALRKLRQNLEKLLICNFYRRRINQIQNKYFKDNKEQIKINLKLIFSSEWVKVNF